MIRIDLEVPAMKELVELLDRKEKMARPSFSIWVYIFSTGVNKCKVKAIGCFVPSTILWLMFNCKFHSLECQSSRLEVVQHTPDWWDALDNFCPK